MDVDDNFALPCLRPWPPHLIKFFPLHIGGGVGIAILWWKKVKKIVEKLGSVYFFLCIRSLDYVISIRVLLY